VFYYTGNFALSVTAAVCASIALSALHSLATYRLRANIFITGLAVNLFSGGLCIVLSGRLFNTRGVVALQNYMPGGIINLYLFFLILLLVIIWLVINKTPFGYRLRACDKSGEALMSLGINPDFYKKNAILISGALCGIGGSFLSLNLGAFVPGMSAGKGWIALVVIYLGRQKPLGFLAAALVYCIAESFSNYAQGFWNLPADFLLAFPYAITLLAMIILSKEFS
jgi:simple sugar transport system permease protein